MAALVRTNYSKKDNDFIKDNYEFLSDDQMASALQRTRRGIEGQRAKLGLLHERSLRHVHIALNNQKEMRGLEELLADGRLTHIAERRLNELRQDHKFIKTNGNTPKMPLASQALCYELYYSGMSLLQISKKLGFTWTKVDRVIKRILPYTGEGGVTVTMQSRV
jgi:hypothetical protein